MQHVELSIVDRIATLVLNRPESCNALNSQLIADLTLAISDVHQEKRVDAIVITGKGEHFCSGVDLKAFAKVSEMEPMDAQTEWFGVWRELTELCETILRFPKPVVAAIDGPAIGAGLAALGVSGPALAVGNVAGKMLEGAAVSRASQRLKNGSLSQGE